MIASGEQIVLAIQNVGQNRANLFQLHQPASFQSNGELAGLILTIQTFLTNILARYPITTTVQP
jgi:hypothetical protein